MSERYLTIMEVSQKQNYIFSSNKLKDNIRCSEEIAYVTSSDFFASVTKGKTLYSEESNYVYAGGGHTVLEFQKRKDAYDFNREVTLHIHREYPDMEVFVSILPYDSALSPNQNMQNLTKKLEQKKSERRAAFHQGSFGVEQTDLDSLEPKRVKDNASNKQKDKQEDKQEDKGSAAQSVPEGYRAVERFEELGGTKGESGFLAIVHIDGNGMGKRVAEFYQKHEKDTWQEFKTAIRTFSDGIDGAFKDAFGEMNQCVKKQNESHVLDELSLEQEKEGKNFPIRRIISSGDDICFVSEGRIGIESAVTFLRALANREDEDGNPYAACAGVAIVHQKYPFYKAYELAEALCSNAKKFGAELANRQGLSDNGAGISSIDWHIEQGEIGDSLEEIRSGYATRQGERLELRPLIVRAPEQILQAEPYRQYQTVKKLLKEIKKTGDDNVRGKLKEMRKYLKQGEDAAASYIRFHKLEDITLKTYQGIFKEVTTEQIGTGEGLEREIFLKTSDGMHRSIVFDAVELMDTYIPFQTEG